MIAPLAGAALLVALAVTASFWAFRQTRVAADARKQAYAVLNSADDLLSELRDAETSQRGYLLTDDETFLEPYLAVRDSISVHLQTLRASTALTAAQLHIDAMAPLVTAKLTEMARLVELRRNHFMTAAQMRAVEIQSKRSMGLIRDEMRRFVAIEASELTRHEAEFQANMHFLFVVIVIASVLILLLTLSFAYLLYRELQHRLKKVAHLETQQLLQVQQETNQQLQQTNVILQLSEEKLAVTLSSIGDAVITTDAQACVTLLNPLGERLTGWTQVEACGRRIEDIFHVISKETRHLTAVPVIETLTHGTIQGLTNHTVLIARDGTECDIADSCAPIRNREGQVIGAVLVFRNVTGEYAAQQALRDSNALIQTMLNTVVDGIITLRAHGGIIETVNPAAERMFGFTAAELIGQQFSLLIPELDRDQRSGGGSLEYYSAGAEERAAGLGREVMGRRKDQSIFPMEIAASEMWLGGQRYFTGILRDITARKHVEKERTLFDLTLKKKNVELESAKSLAEKANLAKTDFLSSMSHELRTPLNAILGFAQLMESGSPLPTPSQKRSIHQILHAGWYLLELINEILDLALIESGKLSLSMEPVSLGVAMRECQAMIEPQAQKRGITVTFPRLEMPHFVKADRTRVKQVLINLLSNAIKYNKPRGTVVVDCIAARGHVRIRVTDTGDGLIPEKVAQLFEPFNRLGQEASMEEGTGIGLVVSKRLVEWMGGSIGVESVAGKGSMFWIELKLTAEPQPIAALPLSVALAQIAVDAPLRTLLYVEDNPANLMLVEDLIARRPDIRLLTAEDGTRGVEIASASLPDVILMDINLPGISGITALKILIDDPATAHIPVIALSANAMPRDIEKGLKAGFFRYLTKPIKVKQFMDTLDVALEFAQTHSLSIQNQTMQTPSVQTRTQEVPVETIQ